MDKHLRDAQSPVIFHINGIGDRLMAVPAVRALCELYPGRLRVVGAPGDALLFYSGLPLRDVCELPSEMKGTHRVLEPGALRQALGDCDLLVSFNTWHTSALNTLLGDMKDCESIGFFQGFKQWVPKLESRHVCDQFFELVQLIEPSLRFEDFAQPPCLPPAAIAVGNSFRANVPAGTRVLAVHTETAPSKQWPLERFRSVLDAFLKRHPEWLVIVLDQVDPGLESISRGEQVLAASGMPLPTAMALVGNCDAFLGVDSCMLHAADFFRLPAIGLFGPTSEQRWGFRVTTSYHHITGTGRMENIDEGVVTEALEELARHEDTRIEAVSTR